MRRDHLKTLAPEDQFIPVVVSTKVAEFSPPSHIMVKTMSSVEIVEVINAMRKPGSAVLRHADFMVKLEKHPGINERNFSGVYSDPKGEKRPCYYLPKREAELMVMSESLEVSPEGVAALPAVIKLDDANGVQTMSSLEMVAFINAYKDGTGWPKLRHDTFMAKVPKVLGETACPKFSGHVQAAIGNGATRAQAIYNFPKREAMLMAMSFSYELQAMVFDAWQAAEAKAPAASVAADDRLYLTPY